MVELELQCNSALKESAPKWQEDAISSYYKTHHDAAIKTPLLTIQLWIQLHTYIHIQGSSLSISSHKSVILQVQSRPLSAMHGGLTQPCLMYILYNYVRPGSLRGPGVFLTGKIFYLCGDRVLVLGYTEYVGGSSGQYSGYRYASGIPGSPYNPPMTQCHSDATMSYRDWPSTLPVFRISHEYLCVD